MSLKVIKSGIDRKVVYDFLLVVYIVTFAVSHTVHEKCDITQSHMTLNPLIILPDFLRL